MEKNQKDMEEELQKLNELSKKEIKEIKDKYNKLKREVRKKYKDKMPTKPKTKRIKVPKKLKNMIWDKNIGKTLGVGNCYCCSEEIDSKNFEAGHIISVKNGGETILDNLKPICSCCNKSMGAENLEIFKQKYMKSTPNPYAHYFTNSKIQQKRTYGIGMNNTYGIDMNNTYDMNPRPRFM